MTRWGSVGPVFFPSRRQWFSGTGQEQLFDLSQDPQELHDLMRTPEGEARARRWRQALIAELQGREEGFTDGQWLIAGRPTTPVLTHTAPETARE